MIEEIILFITIILLLIYFKNTLYYYLFSEISNLLNYSLLSTDDDEDNEDIEFTNNNNNFKDIQWKNTLTIFLNGNPITLTNPDPDALLVTFIRDSIGLKGTKIGCGEGGCGACTVILTKKEENSTISVRSVNSCLRSLCLNDGMSITTIEGIGSINTGLSIEQQSIVDTGGTQCGFCSPGFVTNMHALNESNKASGSNVTKQQLEDYLDGNLCRCTGYKPILKAFETFSKCDRHDVNLKDICGGSCTLSNGNKDIEDLTCGNHHREINHNEITSKSCKGKKSNNIKKNITNVNELMNSYTSLPLMFFNSNTNKRWIRPINIEQLCAILREYSSSSIQLVGGNTSIGVTKYLNDTGPYNSPDKYDIFVDINSIPIMTTSSYDNSTGELIVGSSCTLTNLISLLQQYSPLSTTSSDSSLPNQHSIFSTTAHHLSMIANTQVRNAGSWAGNLMIFMKHLSSESFPSDAVLALTTANATLTLCNKYGKISTMTMQYFIESATLSMFENQGLMIISISIIETRYPLETIMQTYKVGQRAKNAHAHVNAGFLFKIKSRSQTRSVAGSVEAPICTYARVVFGGVSSKTFCAKRTELILGNNSPLNRQTLQRALVALQQDLNEVGKSTLWGSQEFRESVMQSCLYKAFLKCYPITDLPSSLVSAVLPWVKPATRGTELYLPSQNEGVVGKPVKKLEAPIQVTGEAAYPSDEQMSKQGLFAAMLFSARGAVILNGFDTAKAMSLNGVVRFFTSSDITGSNDINGVPLFTPIGAEVTCVGTVLGAIVATSEALANEAASLIQVLYKETGKPLIMNLDQAIEKNSFYDIPADLPQQTLLRRGDPEQAMANAKHRKSGKVRAGGQNIFYMETQTATATPLDGQYIDITCGTQDPNTYKKFVADILNVSSNKINVKCPRVGGGYGGKLTRGIPIAASAALIASVLRRPVHIFNTRTADMQMSPGRDAVEYDYEIGYDENGLLLAVIYDVYIDVGVNETDGIGALFMGMTWADNAYYLPNYIARAKICYTNTPTRTYARAPGVLQSCLATETLLERISIELNLPTCIIQQRNFIQNGQTTIVGQLIHDCTLPTVWNTLLNKSNYNQRLAKVQDYNYKNLWRKKGISICPVKYGMGWAGYNAGVIVGVSQGDGCVTITHNGSEIGQGINTKVAQAVSMSLNIDMNLIRVSSLSTSQISNGGGTGGSSTSEVCCQAAVNACKNLLERIKPYNTNNSNQTTSDWIAMINTIPCDISLQAEGWFSPQVDGQSETDQFQYFVYAACVTEVELDVLSGQVHVLASEIVYDCGQSLNPLTDLGQIEGAYIMGLGYFLTESMEYSNDTGMLLTNGTWEYKPPMIADIPSVFNVTLLRNMYNNDGILGSKAVGEPPMVTSNSVYFALKMAIQSSRFDASQSSFGNTSTINFDLEVPSTIDVRQTASLVCTNRFQMPC